MREGRGERERGEGRGERGEERWGGWGERGKVVGKKYIGQQGKEEREVRTVRSRVWCSSSLASCVRTSDKRGRGGGKRRRYGIKSEGRKSVVGVND